MYSLIVNFGCSSHMVYSVVLGLGLKEDPNFTLDQATQALKGNSLQIAKDTLTEKGYVQDPDWWQKDGGHGFWEYRFTKSADANLPKDQ